MNNLEGALNTVGQHMEAGFRVCKNMPQYKYFTRPIYKACVGKIGDVAATGVSFLAADLVIHQFLPQVAICLTSSLVSLTMPQCNLTYHVGGTLYWAAFALPVMYAKYKKHEAAKEATEIDN